MAPEQLAEKDTDPRGTCSRSGACFTNPHRQARVDGSNTASVIAAVMERSRLRSGRAAPAESDRVLKRCWRKPDRRWQNALDLKWALAGAMESRPASQPAAPTRSRFGITAAGLGGGVWTCRDRAGGYARPRAAPGAPLRAVFDHAARCRTADIARRQTSDLFGRVARRQGRYRIRSLDSTTPQPLQEPREPQTPSGRPTARRSDSCGP